VHAHPVPAKPCTTCGDLTGRGYPSCPGCATAVDHPWQSAWSALPDPDPERVADAPAGEYPWQCVDWALRQLRCADCGGELAAGAADCVGCATADAARWQLPTATRLEHVLRAAVVSLRAQAWHRQAVPMTWRLWLPFLVGGYAPAPEEVREVRTQVVAGRYEELADLEVLPLAVPLLPWRRFMP
jgi:hypothetical protein